ncbi:MAG TPA: hemolysin family protein [Bryobacteraceae bacterium]|nr:hemolysin family protein [Bryobacteraceae bacterium]
MEESYMGYRFLLLIIILSSNAFFASAEMSLISARHSRLRELAAAGNVGAQAALNLLGRPERLLATVQVGVTLAGLGLGWAGEDTVYRTLIAALQPLMTPQTQAALHAASFVVAFLVLTFLTVVLGEVVPKNLGIKTAERYAVVVAPLLLVFYRISEPFIFVLERSSAVVSRALGLGAEESRTAHSVEEVKLIASSVRAAGRMTSFEESCVHRILDLGNVAVREVMVPRNDIVSIPADASLDYALRTLVDNQYTRLPVYEASPEKIVGILHYKDLLPVWQRARSAGRMSTPPTVFRLRSLIRKPLVVPESKPLNQMVDEFRQHRSQMAMVVDEFGTIVGLVTLEDVLEQVFGEIEDEHDVHRPRPSLASRVIELEGTASIRDLESQYGIVLPTNAGFETLAGFLLFRLGDIPAAGETLEYDGRRFTILEMDNNRIARVRIEKLPPAPAAAKPAQ